MLRAAGPLLFLNQGDGTFALRPDAFHFGATPQGSFTGMAAADYDRDGRVDLYLCTYIYFQSEDQYRYPAPYHDAQNGPPNFLFRNQLQPRTGRARSRMSPEASGMNQNNNRYSFAPAWCDYDGDGWPDLYVANDFGRNNLYENRGGQFPDVARGGGRRGHRPGNERRVVRLRWRRPARSLRVEYVERCGPAGDARRRRSGPRRTDALREAYRRHTKGNSLYRNRGDGTFAETRRQEQRRDGPLGLVRRRHRFR